MIPAVRKDKDLRTGQKVYWPGYWTGIPARWVEIKVALPFRTKTAAIEAAKHYIERLQTGEPEPEAV